MLGKAYKVYADDQKTLLLYYLKLKMYKAGRMAGIAKRTARKLKKDSEWGIYEKTNKVSHQCRWSKTWRNVLQNT